MTATTPETIYFLSHRTSEVLRLSPKYFILAANQESFAPYTFDAQQSHLVPPSDYTADDIHTFHSTEEILDYFQRLILDEYDPTHFIRSFIAILQEDIEDFSSLYTAGDHIERGLRQDIIQLNQQIRRLQQIKQIRTYCHDITADRALYLTAERFAEAHGLTTEDAEAFLWIARKITNTKHPEA